MERNLSARFSGSCLAACELLAEIEILRTVKFTDLPHQQQYSSSRSGSTDFSISSKVMRISLNQRSSDNDAPSRFGARFRRVSKIVIFLRDAISWIRYIPEFDSSAHPEKRMPTSAELGNLIYVTFCSFHSYAF